MALLKTALKAMSQRIAELLAQWYQNRAGDLPFSRRRDFVNAIKEALNKSAHVDLISPSLIVISLSKKSWLSFWVPLPLAAHLFQLLFENFSTEQ